MVGARVNKFVHVLIHRVVEWPSFCIGFNPANLSQVFGLSYSLWLLACDLVSPSRSSFSLRRMVWTG